MPDYLSFVYAILLLIGGIVGYVKAGSRPSLIAGSLFAIVMAVGAYLATRDPSNWYLLMVENVVLALFMGYRFFSSGKLIPAGLITIISLFMIVRFTGRALGWFSF